ncbi:MAG: hypothetical protein JW881_06640 [Spirochaetales bacterium]|nr:hypothetical protein [Spirochaetales bacterium]
MRLKYIFIFIIFLLSTPFSHPVYGEEKPLAVVLDFSGSGISEKDTLFLIDILTINLLETGKVNMISRTERNAFLQARQFPLSEMAGTGSLPELGKLLYADYLIGGKITGDKGPVKLTLFLYDAESGRISDLKTREYSEFAGLIDNLRDCAHELVLCIPPGQSRTALSQKVLKQVSPVPVREKILFIFRKHDVTGAEAAQKDMFYSLVSMLTDASRFIPYYTEIDFDFTAPPLEAFVRDARSKECGSFAFIRQTTDGHRPSHSFVVYDNSLTERLAVPVDPPVDPEEKAREIGELMTEHLLLPQRMIGEEVRKNLYLEQKIGELLLAERLFSKRFSLRFHQKLFKSIYTPTLHPDLNLVSGEIDLFWYYLDILGTGVGYGFNLGYPGTLDSSLNNHPLVYQHELRFTPLSLRAGGRFCLVFDYLISIALHNMYRITSHIDGPLTYENSGFTVYMKAGLDIGCLFYFSPSYAVYIDLFTLFYSLPIIPHPQDNGIRHFSGDLGGIGFNFSF